MGREEELISVKLTLTIREIGSSVSFKAMNWLCPLAEHHALGLKRKIIRISGDMV